MGASKKSFRTWIYHATEEPKIIDSENFESYEAKGWADTPAKFINLEKDFGLDPKDPEHAIKTQQIGETVEGVKESINGALNLHKMSPKELEAYAKEHFGVDIDRRKSHTKLLKEVRNLVNGNGK
jgi:hypothetical protein